MPNGGSGPEPEMSETVWNTIKNATWEDYGWDIGGTTKWLHVQVQTPTAWALYDDDPRPGWTRCKMTSSDWGNISGGTLDTQENSITKSHVEYWVQFVTYQSEYYAYPKTH